ncbi:Integrator complex subunit 2 [Mortierella polycephala]|uniref:Integrator complex subunit 2 n=1 Tax=Mortierella polycephala TaxID=41804 RepID=A0A9P6Q236_9FUNG|nr:Integrator complex subunit 2 [Mortierella polycephala]
MGNASEAFRLIETGGDPRQHPTLDYVLFLPLILSRYSLDTVAFLLQYPQLGTALRYRDLDYRLIQRQVKEELQLEKQNIGTSWASLRGLFETGTPEDRARIVLLELAKLQWDRDNEDKVDMTHAERERRIKKNESLVVSNPLYRQEVAVLLATLTIRCRHPVLDVQAVIRSLRSVQDQEPLISAIVSNNPTEFSNTIDSLLDPYDPFINSKTLLLRLCKLADHRTWNIRQQLVDRKQFPNLAIELTIEHCHDEVCFMNRILQGQPNWLTAGTDQITNTSLTSIMEFIFSSLNDELNSNRPNHVEINRLLRILSGMIGLMNLSLSEEQLEISMGILEMSPPEPSTVKTKVCLILMAASDLLAYSASRLENVLHQLLKCRDSPQLLLISIYCHMKELIKVDQFASQVLSMTITVPRGGILALSEHFTSIFSSSELASCALALGRPTPPPAPTEHSLQEPTTQASTATPGQLSDGNISELRSTANFCVSHLLKYEVFHKSSIDIRSWVMEQIRATTVPLDTNMIPLLRAYTNATSHSASITRIPEEDIREVFKNPSDDLTPAKVVLVLYMLLNNDAYTTNLGSGTIPSNREYDATLLDYVQVRKVLLFVQTFQGGMAFKTVQPMFLKLVNAQFPELFDVPTLLLEEELASSSSTIAPTTSSSMDDTKKSLSSTKPQHRIHSTEASLFMERHFRALVQHVDNPDAAMRGYHAFQRLRQVDRQNLARTVIYAATPTLLDPRSSPTVMEAFKRTWDQLNSLMPHDLWSMTIQALLPRNTSISTSPSAAFRQQQDSTPNQLPKSFWSQHQQQQQQEASWQDDYYTFDNMVKDPLLLFKVDIQVFRTPVVFRLFIQILGAVMVGSRHWFRKHFDMSQALFQCQQNRNPFQAQQTQKARQFKETNLNAMLYIQDTALIQILLEVCEARPEDIIADIGDNQSSRKQAKGVMMEGERSKDGEGVTEVLKEVRVVTFNFLHQIFLEHKIVLKLIHFQGYSRKLLPTTVAGIDSIHVCLDFLQELLFFKDSATHAGVGVASVEDRGSVQELQLFAIGLAVQLCERFPLEKTISMASEFIMLRLRDLAARTGFGEEMRENARLLARAFPTLGKEIILLLEEASRPKDQAELQKTIEAIEQELKDRAIWDKSTL